MRKVFLLILYIASCCRSNMRTNSTMLLMLSLLVICSTLNASPVVLSKIASTAMSQAAEILNVLAPGKILFYNCRFHLCYNINACYFFIYL